MARAERGSERAGEQEAVNALMAAACIGRGPPTPKRRVPPSSRRGGYSRICSTGTGGRAVGSLLGEIQRLGGSYGRGAVGDERAALAGLEFLGEVDRRQRRRIPTHRYRFLLQESGLCGAGKTCTRAGGQKIGKAVEVGTDNLDHRRQEDEGDVRASTRRRSSPTRYSTARSRRCALFRLGEYVAEHGGSAAKATTRLARALLLNEPPRLRRRARAQGGRPPLEAALRARCGATGRGVYPIQGPPGTGKSYTAARMICRPRSGRQDGRDHGATATRSSGACSTRSWRLRRAIRTVDLQAAFKKARKEEGTMEPDLDAWVTTPRMRCLHALADGLMQGRRSNEFPLVRARTPTMPRKTCLSLTRRRSSRSPTFVAASQSARTCRAAR